MYLSVDFVWETCPGVIARMNESQGVLFRWIPLCLTQFQFSVLTYK